jgi:hypothetical protein
MMLRTAGAVSWVDPAGFMTRCGRSAAKRGALPVRQNVMMIRIAAALFMFGLLMLFFYTSCLILLAGAL